MEKLEIYQRSVTVPNWAARQGEALAIEAYLAAPVEAGTFPSVIIIQEIFGVNAHIRNVVERVAQLGYVAIAPAIYQRLAPGFAVGYGPEDVNLGRQYKEQTRVEELLSDLQATIDWLQAQPNVLANAIGCMGFCFGGHVAYLAATLPAIKATATFYGAGIPTWSPGGGAPTIERTPEIKGTVYGFFGTADASIPPEHIDQIAAALQACQVPHRLFCYAGADHGFFCDQRSSYHPEAAAAAWLEVQNLLRSLTAAAA